MCHLPRAFVLRQRITRNAIEDAALESDSDSIPTMLHRNINKNVNNFFLTTPILRFCNRVEVQKIKHILEVLCRACFSCLYPELYNSWSGCLHHCNT
jgi:hypothetical protein